MNYLIVNAIVVGASATCGGLIGYGRGIAAQANGKVGAVGRWLTKDETSR